MWWKEKKNPTHLALKKVKSNYYKRSICTYTHGSGLTQSPHTEWTFHSAQTHKDTRVRATSGWRTSTSYIQIFPLSAAERSFFCFAHFSAAISWNVINLWLVRVKNKVRFVRVHWTWIKYYLQVMSVVCLSLRRRQMSLSLFHTPRQFCNKAPTSLTISGKCLSQ